MKVRRALRELHDFNSFLNDLEEIGICFPQARKNSRLMESDLADFLDEIR